MICILNKNFHFHEFNLINQREELNVEKVPMFQIHNVGTVSIYKMPDIRTVPTFNMHNIGPHFLYNFLSLKLDCMTKIDDRSLLPFFYLNPLCLNS